MKKLLLTLVLGLAFTAAAADKDGWISLFDGKSLAGWKANENPDTFSVADGELIVKGPRAHLFYVGDVNGAKFKNFELKLDIMTKPKANTQVLRQLENLFLLGLRAQIPIFYLLIKRRIKSM